MNCIHDRWCVHGQQLSNGHDRIVKMRRIQLEKGPDSYTFCQLNDINITPQDGTDTDHYINWSRT